MKPATRHDLGSFLSDAPPARRASRPQHTRVTTTGRVRKFLRDEALAGDPERWFSNAEIGAALGLTIGQVNGAMNGLVQLGEVERSLPPERARRKAGQTFRWVVR